MDLCSGERTHHRPYARRSLQQGQGDEAPPTRTGSRVSTLKKDQDVHQAYAKNYRNALVHRIPLYVPPAIYSPSHEQRYRELETEISAALRQDDFNRVQVLTDEQDSIGGICPAFRQSLLDEDACEPINLHAQIIADARTVMEIVNVLRPHLTRRSG